MQKANPKLGFPRKNCRGRWRYYVTWVFFLVGLFSLWFAFPLPMLFVTIACTASMIVGRDREWADLLLLGVLITTIVLTTVYKIGCCPKNGGTEKV